MFDFICTAIFSVEMFRGSYCHKVDHWLKIAGTFSGRKKVNLYGPSCWACVCCSVRRIVCTIDTFPGQYCQQENGGDAGASK